MIIESKNPLHGADRVKTVSSQKAGAVNDNADFAISQLRREPAKRESNAKRAAKRKSSSSTGQHDESPPELAEKVAHVIVENTSNPLYHADRAALADELADVIGDLRPGETLVVVNSSGSHQFAGGEGP